MEEEVVTVGNGRFRWGPIWGGLFVVAAIQIVLQLFGMAIGISVMHPTASSVEGVSIWAGIWAVISTLLAFFCGGWFAATAEEAPIARTAAVRSGIAVWGFALTVGIFLTTAGLLGAVDLARALLLPPGAQAGVHSGYTIGAAWATFGTVLLSLGCAVGGALLGAPRTEVPRRRIEERRQVPLPRSPSPTMP